MGRNQPPEKGSEKVWTGIDLHVHTPASRDYKGARDDREYIRLLRLAVGPEGPDEDVEPFERPRISTIAITDHNSVEGFKKLFELRRRIGNLVTSLRVIDPENSLIPKLENELRIFGRIHILMGLELKADPGVHLLIIFRESIQPERAEHLLSDALGDKWPRARGDSAPMASWTVSETLTQVDTRFGEDAFVVAPHADSSSGLLEVFRELGQARMNALRHPALAAISFSRTETRQWLRNLLRDPNYKRDRSLAFIQASDFHGEEGEKIGLTHAQVLVPDGRATFRAIASAFDVGGAKCTVDFVDDIYRLLTRGIFVKRIECNMQTGEIPTSGHDEVAVYASALWNGTGGVLEADFPCAPEQQESDGAKLFQEQLQQLLAQRIKPRVGPFGILPLRVSPGKLRILSHFPSWDHLTQANGVVCVLRDGKAVPADPHEIETTVARNINRRFGQTFKEKLSDVSMHTRILSTAPGSFPIILKAENKLSFGLHKKVEVQALIETKDREDLIEKLVAKYPVGLATGDVSLVRKVPSRFPSHYLRFSTYCVPLNQRKIQGLSLPQVDTSIAVRESGGVTLIQPSHLVLEQKAALLKLASDSGEDDYLFLLAWFKCSFFLWYLTLVFGPESLYGMLLSSDIRRIPVLRDPPAELRLEVTGLAKNILSEEKQFLLKAEKEERHSAALHKLMDNHNSRCNKMCLSMDKRIFEQLRLSERDQLFISDCLRDFNYSDYGLSEESKA